MSVRRSTGMPTVRQRPRRQSWLERGDNAAVQTPIAVHGGTAAEDAVEAGVEAHSSLPLQVSLYFHKYYAVVWFIGTLRLTRDDDGGNHGGVWSGAFHAILYSLLYILEPMTLALGYFGNLSERTSALAGFGLTSISIKLLPTLWLMMRTKVVMIVILNAILAAFHVLETVLAFAAIAQMSRHETAHRIVLQPAADLQPDIEMIPEGDDTSTDEDRGTVVRETMM
eukprot:m.231846 g.231846  ORF g.231846 m.231846 type:complete len:225 (+) comp40976_c0_seq1:191-865(+)